MSRTYVIRAVHRARHVTYVCYTSRSPMSRTYVIRAVHPYLLAPAMSRTYVIRAVHLSVYRVSLARARHV
eukprot:6209537-Prymnesium_polylepis.1